MAQYADCIAKLVKAAGRKLSDKEAEAIFSKLDQAARDIKAERVVGGDVGVPRKGALGTLGHQLGKSGDNIFQEAAQRAAIDLQAEASRREQNAYKQVVVSAARMDAVKTMAQAGVDPQRAVEATYTRDYSGQFNIASLEQMVKGYKDYFGSKLLSTWDALGNDYFGFFQDREKVLHLIRELRGEDSGDALAKKGAKAFHNVAEEARLVFNEYGGNVASRQDWGIPQHHSQRKVAAAGKETWINDTLPKLDIKQYMDDGIPWGDSRLREFLGHAYDTIASNGHANIDPSEFKGSSARANKHAEHREIHFKDAESLIDYWNQYGERTVLEVLHGHIDTMARDIAFIEHGGPNPDMTYRMLREWAIQTISEADRTKTEQAEGRATKLDNIYNAAAGRTIPTYHQWLKATADGLANLNVAAKLGTAMFTSLFGDRPIMEAVSHLNDLPEFQRWSNQLALLNPANAADRKTVTALGLGVDSIRSSLQRYYDGLGESSFTGKLANTVMRITGMNAINELPRKAFGLTLMSRIGDEIQTRDFASLADSDVRALKHFGITEADWKTWKLSKMETIIGNEHVLTPESISHITDDELRNAGVIGQADSAKAGADARRNAIVKLLGLVNTESEFALVTPGWKERAELGRNVQRGTWWGEVQHSVSQFKTFPWTQLKRGMDLVANQEGMASKAAMGAYLIGATTLAGAAISQIKDLLTGKDPRSMVDDNWPKFWGNALIQGGALGIYGDFLYGTNQTRYGTGPLEIAAGPTIGPLLEMGLTQPMSALKAMQEGKPTHIAAQEIRNLKGFIPGGNIWYTKAAMDHLIWQNIMESVSPGYLSSIRQRSMKDYHQGYYWRPGESSPERAPNMSAALEH